MSDSRLRWFGTLDGKVSLPSEVREIKNGYWSIRTKNDDLFFVSASGCPLANKHKGRNFDSSSSSPVSSSSSMKYGNSFYDENQPSDCKKLKTDDKDGSKKDMSTSSADSSSKNLNNYFENLRSNVISSIIGHHVRMPTEPISESSMAPSNPEHYLSKLQTICETTTTTPQSALPPPTAPPPPPPPPAVAMPTHMSNPYGMALPTQPLPPPQTGFNPLSTRL